MYNNVFAVPYPAFDHTKAIFLLWTAVSLLVLSWQAPICSCFFLCIEQLILVWWGAKPIDKGLTSVGCSG